MPAMRNHTVNNAAKAPTAYIIVLLVFLVLSNGRFNRHLQDLQNLLLAGFSTEHFGHAVNDGSGIDGAGTQGSDKSQAHLLQYESPAPACVLHFGHTLIEAGSAGLAAGLRVGDACAGLATGRGGNGSAGLATGRGGGDGRGAGSCLAGSFSTST